MINLKLLKCDKILYFYVSLEHFLSKREHIELYKVFYVYAGSYQKGDIGTLGSQYCVRIISIHGCLNLALVSRGGKNIFLSASLTKESNIFCQNA